MGYYSTMYTDNIIINNSKKIDIFNKIASMLDNYKMNKQSIEQLSPETRYVIKEFIKSVEITPPITEEKKIKIIARECNGFFPYRLNSKRELILANDEYLQKQGLTYDTFSSDENGCDDCNCSSIIGCETKHYATYYLAILLSLIADNSIALKLIGEDLEIGGHYINSKYHGKPYLLKMVPTYYDENGYIHVILDNKEITIKEKEAVK